MDIHTGRLDHPALRNLIARHLSGMHELSPAESVHALGLASLSHPDITMFSAWEGDSLLGCGALKQLDTLHGEVKSMRTAVEHLRKGVAQAILTRIIEAAREKGYKRLSLETGTSGEFVPAHRLYERFGFQPCGPFGEYQEDVHSRFMTLDLENLP